MNRELLVRTFSGQFLRVSDRAEEKTGGRWASRDVVCLTLDTVRQGPEAVAATLRGLGGGRVVVVDALTENDLRTATGPVIRY